MTEFARLKELLSELSPVSSVTPVDMLQLPDRVGGAMRKMMRTGLTAAELGRELDLTADEGAAVGDLLVAKGYLQREPAAGEAKAGGERYVVKFTRMRGRAIPFDL
jgi:hypothetical protein